MDEHTQANRTLWNRWTVRDMASDHHQDVAVFRGGGLSLRAIERHELGDALETPRTPETPEILGADGGMAGKSLLHLQCNMGSDTLSWARLGAHVTGVDFAEAAIAQARALAAEAGLAARFLCADLYALPDTLTEQFDIVYTSYGALCWLPDLDHWARVAAHFVKPGGTFYIVDMHPVGGLIVADAAGGLRLRQPNQYFHADAPLAETSGTGAARETVYTWSYSLGEAVTALLNAGLRLDFVHEHPRTFWRQFSLLVPDGEGYWRWPTPENTAPLLFSIRATRPES